MKIIVLYFFITTWVTVAVAQQNHLYEAGKEPYVLVDSFRVDLRHMVMNPSKIEAVKILKDSIAIAFYGAEAKYGAILVKTKPNTILLRIGDIFTKYKVSGPDQHLGVCINKVFIDRPERILIENSEIIDVEITNDRYWVHAEDAQSGERFINIRTAKTSE